MRQLRKLIASLSMVAILSTLVVTNTAFAGTFGDVPADDYSYDSIEQGVAEGWIDSSRGDFNPNDGLNRAEAAAMVAEAANLTCSVPSTPTFSDVPATFWGYEAIECAFANGVVSGYSHAPGTYGPGDAVTRAQFAKIAVNAFDIPDASDLDNPFDDVPASAWYHDVVVTAYWYGVLNGKTSSTFDPDGPVVRKDAAVITVQSGAAELRDGADDGGDDDGGDDGGDDDGGDDGDDDEEPEPEVDPGAVTVENTSDDDLDSEPIVVDATNGGQAKVGFITMDMRASSAGPVEVTEMMFTRGGISKDADIDNAYLYVQDEDGKVWLAGEMINISDNVLTFRDTGGLFTVPAGDTYKVWMKVDVNKDIASGQTLNFSIESDDITSNATSFSGDASVTGVTRSVATVTDLGKLEVGTVSQSSSVDPGEEDFELWRFKLIASNQRISVSKIVLTEIGTISSDDLENIYLEFAGEAITEEMNLDASKKYVADFSDDPLVLESGQTANISVKGDVVGGTNRNFKFSVQEDSDINAYDLNYNTDIRVVDENGTVGSFSIVEAGAATSVTTGTLTITKHIESPVNRVATGLNGEEIASFLFTAAGEPVKVTSLGVSCLQSGNVDLNDGKVYLNDVQVGTTNDLNCDAADDTNVTSGGDDTIFTFSGNNFIVPVGENKVSIYADTKSPSGTNLTAGQTLQINLNAGTNNAQGKESLVSLSSTSSTANQLTVSGVAVTVSENTGLQDAAASSPSGVLGGDLKVGSFVVKGGAASVSQVTQLVIKDDFDAATYDGNGNAIEANGALSAGASKSIDGLSLAEAQDIKVGDVLLVTQDDDAANFATFTVTAVTENGASSSITGTVSDVNGVAIADDADVDITDSSTTSMADLFQNLKLVDNATGEELGTTKGTLTDTAATTYTYSLSPFVELAESEELVVDVYAKAKTGVSLFNYNNDSDGLFQPTSVSATTENGTDASDTSVSQSLQVIHIAPSGSLEISPQATPTESQIQLGATGVELARFKFEAGEAEDVNVEQIVVDNAAGSSNVFNIVLKDATSGEPVGTIASLDANFDNFADLPSVWTIPAGQSKTLIVEGSVSPFSGDYLIANADIQIAIINQDGEGSNDTIARGDQSSTAIAETYTTTSTTAVANTHFGFRTTLAGARNASSPSGNQTPSGEQQVLAFDLEADTGRSATFRQGVELSTCAQFNSTATITVAHGNTAATEVQNSACEATAMGTVADGVIFDAGAGSVDNYSNLSFWIQFNDQDSGGETPDFNDLAIHTSTSTNAADNQTTLAASNYNAEGQTAMIQDIWYQVTVPVPAATDAGDRYVGLSVVNNGNTTVDADDYFIDEVYLYNDSITVDLTSNNVFYDEDVADAQNSPAVLKSGSTTLAEGFVSIKSDGADSNDTNSTAKVVFVPINHASSDGTDRQEFVVDAGTTRTFSAYVDTLSLINVTANDDLLTPTIDLGLGSTDGDILWYDDGIAAATITDSIGWVYNSGETKIQPVSALSY